MILLNNYNAGPFIYCVGYISPNEKFTYVNEGEGHYHQFAYAESTGVLTVIDPNTNQEVSFEKPEDYDNFGFLFDFTDKKGWETISSTTDKSVVFLAFNPVPSNRNLSVEMVEGEETKTITATDKRKTVVVFLGSILANNKEVNSLQYVKVLPGSSAIIKSNPDTIYAIVTND